MHYPNPFDFVPFTDHPFLKTREEYNALGERLSGYLEVRLKALTPVHVVGYQVPGDVEGQSYMYRQDEQGCIPAASIRGCLRAFIEALTSSWVSQTTAEYKKVPGPRASDKRHVGFRTFAEYPNTGRRMSRESPPAVHPDFKPRIRQDRKIDVASYLFGIVVEPEKDTETEQGPSAHKAKVWIEDAFIDNNDVIKGEHWVPDIRDTDPTKNSFMGGAKPSASNWWYFQPAEIWRRDVQGRLMAEFIGDKFWGRKFYYHQDPKGCVEYYEKEWEYDRQRPFYRVHLECLQKEAETQSFRIYLDKVPLPLVVLLVKVLMPGPNIRHKLGYGKAYGYGSVEFSLASARLRSDDSGRIPIPLQDLSSEMQAYSAVGWNRKQTVNRHLETLIDWQALRHLARVLGWQGYENLKFTYPPFSSGFFKQPVYFWDFENRTPHGVVIGSPVTKVNATEARAITEQLFDIKKPIHFRQYQETAEGWPIIKERKP
ncbi:MAG: RAMP superfamily CRISPR-associated protein [Chloroflexota bacterium]